MMHFKKVGLTCLLVMLTLVVSAVANPATAHEGRQVGPYTIELGWLLEPAYVGVYNGIEISIVEGEHDEGVPVEGADATLQLEVSFGPKSKALDLEPAADESGHYVAYLIPTRPGDYTFRLSGRIGETAVDETFASADGEFSSVEPASDLQFPEPDPTLADLQAQIDRLQALILELQNLIAQLQGNSGS
jgi:hypothetical protein